MAMNELNRERQNIKIDDEIKKRIEQSTYVICSTLNQMVNYIPFYHFRFKQIYNITIDLKDKSKYFSNQSWDENFRESIKRVEQNCRIEDKISISQKKTPSVKDIKTELESKLEKDKIYFWNITGGQRSFVIAITDFIRENTRENDFLCYLEGNNNKLLILQNNKPVLQSEDYTIDDKEFTIETALQLAGFQSNRNEADKMVKREPDELKKIYLPLHNEYIQNCRGDKKMREFLIATNSKTVDETDSYYKGNLKKAIESYKDTKELAYFGYILEKMAYAVILNSKVKKHLADYAFSYHINFKENEKNDHHDIDEFDIILLTKQGKLIIFECKSGAMEGDVAKSHKYSTYAVAGVYGKPILITPLLAEELGKLGDPNKEMYYLNKEIYDHIKGAVRAAKRAALEIWGIDEIEKKLEELSDIK